MSDRRCILRLAVVVAGLVVLGAVTTVGVAWGCEWLGGRPIPRRTRPTHVWVPEGEDVLEFSITRNSFGSESREITRWPKSRCQIRRDEVVITWPIMGGPDGRETLPRVLRSPVPIAPSSGLTQELGGCVVDLAGWPWRGLCMYGHNEDHPSRFSHCTLADVHLPLDPIWPGFAANTAFHAGAWWLLLIGPRQLRRASRRWNGRCVMCGYSLAGLAAGSVCPECGTTRSESSAAARA